MKNRIFEPLKYSFLILIIASTLSCKLDDSQLTGSIGGNNSDVCINTGRLLSLSNSSMNEGDGNMSVIVAIDAISCDQVTVELTLNSGSATSGVDFSTITNKLVTIPIGSISVTILIPIVSDSTPEGDETFDMTLSNPVNAEIAVGTAVGTIIDDDNNYLLSKMVLGTGGSVDIDVDWTRKLAFVADGNNAAPCFRGIDFSDESLPVEVKSITTVEGASNNHCRGVKLFDSGRRLIVATKSYMDIWDLGADPSDTSDWTRVARSSTTTVGTSNFRLIAGIIEGATTRIHIVSRYNGIASFDYTLAGHALVFVGKGAADADNNSGISFGNDYAISKSWSGTDKVRVHDLSSGPSYSNTEVPSVTSSFSSFMWAGAVSPDGTVGMIGSTQFWLWSYDSGTPAVSVASRLANPGTGSFRGAHIVNDGGQRHIYAAGRNSYSLDVLNITDPVNPINLKSQKINEFDAGQAYALKIDPTTRRGIVVNYSGSYHFVIFDIDKIAVATTQFPLIPEISIGDVAVTEGSNASFTISLDRVTSVDISFDWATSDGTAVSGADYTTSGATGVTIPAGQTSVNVTVPVINDGLSDAGETFNVDISNVNSAITADGTGVATVNE